MKSWDGETVALLIEKLAGLGVSIIRKFSNPEKVITRIVDLTQRVNQQDVDIDAELNLLRAAQREGGGE
jgi:hypothetical protein